MRATLPRLLDSPGTFPRAHLQVGDFYAGRRQWDESIRQYQAGVQANPESKVIYLKRIVDIWLAQEQPARAAPIVAEILKADPADDSAKAVSASLAMARGKPDDIAAAAAQFKTLVEKNSDNAIWRYGYGKALASQGDLEGGRRPSRGSLVSFYRTWRWPSFSRLAAITVPPSTMPMQVWPSTRAARRPDSCTRLVSCIRGEWRTPAASSPAWKRPIRKSVRYRFSLPFWT
jgi:tetratricopeptide (TPR) repeat protein